MNSWDKWFSTAATYSQTDQIMPDRPVNYAIRIVIHYLMGMVVTMATVMDVAILKSWLWGG